MAPRIRAAMSRFLRQQVERSPERDEVLARLAPGTLEHITGTMALAWLDMDVHMDLCNAIQDVLGSERNVELWRQISHDLYRRPMLHSFLSMSVRLFGVSPRTIARVIPRAYASQTQELGHVEVWEHGASTFVELRDFPADRFRFSCYVEGLHGALLGIMEAMFPKTPAPVTVDNTDESRGTVRYRVDTGRFQKR